MIKIKQYTVGKRGKRGAVISLPKIYLDDNNISAGDTLEIFRDNLPSGEDALIIIPKSIKKTNAIEKQDLKRP